MLQNHSEGWKSSYIPPDTLEKIYAHWTHRIKILDRTRIIIPVNFILSLGSVPLANLHGAPPLPWCPNKLEFMVHTVASHQSHSTIP